MADRGDLIGCTVMFHMAEKGIVPITFTINGRAITNVLFCVAFDQEDLKLFPFVSMPDCALLCCKVLRKRLEHERSRRGNTRRRSSSVSPEFSNRFLSALQQTEQKGFFLCFMIKKPLNSSRITF